MIQSILITGGTGSLGQALVSFLTTHQQAWPDLQKIIVLSRDEVKQASMAKEFNHCPQVQFFLGDVRDKDRLMRAFYHVDVVIHAAALKRVDQVANDPLEAKLTNVDGTQNVLDAAMQCGVKKMIMVSSDKACAPTNFYGATKMLAEQLTVSFNTYSFPRGTQCSVVRYGNVFNSRGSVMETWSRLQGQARVEGFPLILPVTDPMMTRFVITMQAAVSLILEMAIPHMAGGEIYIPIIPSMRLDDLVTAYGGTARIVGLRRGGEKMGETLITKEESSRVVWCSQGGQKYYCLLPDIHSWRKNGWNDLVQAELGEYHSHMNCTWLSPDDLRAMIATEGVV